MEASIVIITYRRPGSLATTLASCLAQRGSDGGFEIIVVDNDPAGSARPVVDALAAHAAVPLRYVHEARPGISYARNTGVAVAVGRCIAFIDDDEEADPDWLAAHLATLRRCAADVCVGPVLPRFAVAGATVPAYAYRLFTRDAAVPTGTPVPAWPGIGNTLLLRERCCGGDRPFDPRLGISGGGDAVFLGKLVRGGRKIVWCAEAPLWESIPAERVDPHYLLRRAFRGGQTTTYIHAAVTPREPGRIAYCMASGCVQAAFYGPLGLALRLVGHPNWLAMLARAAMGLGKVVWPPKLHVRLYRRPRPDSCQRRWRGRPA
jgi:succinoglycan biosynthesis protein ExoM